MDRCSEMLEELLAGQVTRIEIARRSAALMTELSYQRNSRALRVFNAAIDAFESRDTQGWNAHLRRLHAYVQRLARTA